MKLSLILAQARSSELSSLSPLDKTDEKVITYINQGLIDLYDEFTILTEEAIVHLRPDLAKTVYTLSSTDTDVTVAGQPFTDGDAMAIMFAYDEKGKPIALNDEEDPFSVFTLSPTQVQIPLLDDKTYVALIYKRVPQLVTYVDSGDGSAVDTEVVLPLQMLKPLIHFIGYRAHGAVDGSVNEENSTHYAKYVAAIQTLKLRGGFSPEGTKHGAFYDRGYV